MSAVVVLFTEAPERGDEVQRLSHRLGLPLAPSNGVQAALSLVLTAQRLELREAAQRNPAAGVYVDFVTGRNAHRRRFGGGRGQPLARAVGLKQGRTPYVLDATAGLGRDAFVLATLGCRLLLLERSGVVAALLEDGLRRARTDTEVAEIAARMRLVHTEAADYLPRLTRDERPDVVYLDPMYPPRGKSALVKKEMRLLQKLLDEPGEDARLLPLARDAARYRVVVKRPRNAEWLTGAKPSMSIEAPNTRYDVYIRRAFDFR